MKLKQQPTDFIVQELSNIQISDTEKKYSIYLLEKQELDTFSALKYLSNQLNIPLFDIGYAGLKDKHALTRQYISIPTQDTVDLSKIPQIHLTFLGYSDTKIKIGDLTGNHFTITVRDIRSKEIHKILQRAQSISVDGIPNYFDSQRFGSVLHQDFIIRQVINNNFEHAVKMYLTEYLKSESKRIKNIKRTILDHWKTLENLTIREKQFAVVIHEYQQTRSWEKAYKKIPAHLRELYVNAYQSYLWNECIKELLKKHVNKQQLFSVEYPLGSLLFYTMLTKQEKENLPETFQTISNTASFLDHEQPIVQTILARQSLTLQHFDIYQKTGNFFKPRARPVIVYPADFFLSEPSIDELNTSSQQPRYKIQLSFSLPKGSYATIVTKKIFGH
ncbi:MAG: tRNA pseudouridine(13) synthase TruD [Candidatus Thermoplasmatota archaeon]